MQSLADKFNELLVELEHGFGSTRQTGFDPVYYVVFPPAEMLAVKQAMPHWIANLKLKGFEPQELSMIDVINNFFQAHPRRQAWNMAAQNPAATQQLINQSLTDALVRENAVAGAVEAKLESLRDIPGAVLLITDLEALHPYLKIGGVEQALQGKFHVPTVVLYPGVRGGAYSLRFLGIHKEDGNYRSHHIG